ncbi:MAG: hypothetical protein AAF902_16305 [Chloroflexota bacterium]
MNFLVDPNTLLAVAEFPEVVTFEDIQSTFEWGRSDMLPFMKEREIRGVVMDYSKTRKFKGGILGEAVYSNAEINRLAASQNINNKAIPVAHITVNTKHETAIRLLLLGAGFNSKSRRKVVRSHSEALQFINESNEQHGRQFSLSDELKNHWPL